MNEIENIKERYKKRLEKPVKENMYFKYFAKSERELIYAENVKKFLVGEWLDCKIIEIGAGGGDNLLFFHRLGVPWENIYANELLDYSVDFLNKRLPNANILPGDALVLNFKDEFDIVFQSTVFSSILDNKFKFDLAEKMMSMVKKDGIIIWYDFKYNNPKNKDVKGLNKKEIKALFSKAKEINFYNVTLAPPIGRRVGRFYNFFNFLFPFLRTHIVAIIKLK